MKELFTYMFCFITCLSFAQTCITNTNSLEFNSSYINIPANTALDITDSITIEAWVNSNAWGVTSAKNSIVCKHGWSSGEAGYVLRAGGTGELSFNIGGISTDTTWHEVVSNTGALSLNTWYHVACSFDGDSLKLFINGVQAAAAAFTGTIAPSPNYNVHIGKLADDIQPETRYWSGMMDEVRIWHRVLTSAELTANMNQHLDTTNAVGLVGYWRFNEGTGITITDLSHTQNNGTAMNTNWTTDVPFGVGPPVPFITHGGPNLYSSSLSNNQWYLDGTLIPGATSDTYTPVATGNYTVTVTDLNGCSATSLPFYIVITGVNENAAEQIILSEYLSGRNLYLNAAEKILKEAEFKIYNVAGLCVLNIEKGNLKSLLNLESLSSGLYITCASIGNSVFKGKIVLQ